MTLHAARVTLFPYDVTLFARAMTLHVTPPVTPRTHNRPMTPRPPVLA
jgi:hypothetical protein